MVKRKMIFNAIILPLVMVGMAFAGPTHERVMKTKVLRTGLQTDIVPASFYNDKKEWVGFDVDVAAEIARRLGDPDYEKNVIIFQKESECFEALCQGRVVTWSTNSSILLGYGARAPGEFGLIGDFFSHEPYAIGLPEDDSRWRDMINFTLQDMWKDGSYERIYEKWYGPDTSHYFPLTRTIEMWP